jgi:hypothetical protein
LKNTFILVQLGLEILVKVLCMSQPTQLGEETLHAKLCLIHHLTTFHSLMGMVLGVQAGPSAREVRPLC